MMVRTRAIDLRRSWLCSEKKNPVSFDALSRILALYVLIAAPLKANDIAGRGLEDAQGPF